MTEKMLMTQALDERDLLVKKINDKIEKIKLVDVKKRNEETTADNRISVEEFSKNAESAYQQITDLIERYQRLDAAIIASNAATWIETIYGKYTVADAIALRNRLKGEGVYSVDASFESSIIEQFRKQYQNAIMVADAKNKNVERQAEEMRMSILGKDSKTKELKPLDVVDAYVKENTTEIIDPLGAKKKMQELHEKIETWLSELNTRIKVSNATTFIEF
ncbi:MAG: hypothetical protein IJI14_18970 [Anaerolineaceae bacterium]|nr:hypothetical protein [Anaerolineaceae bacterium]